MKFRSVYFDWLKTKPPGGGGGGGVASFSYVNRENLVTETTPANAVVLLVVFSLDTW